HPEMAGAGNKPGSEAQENERAGFCRRARPLGCRRFGRHILLAIITHPSVTSRGCHVVDLRCLSTSGDFGPERLDKDPPCSRAERQCTCGADKIGWMREAEEFKDHADCSRSCRKEQQPTSPCTRTRSPRSGPAQHRAECTGKIQARTSAAHGQL